MLNIIVCAKVVTDPEAPVSTFRIDPQERRVLPGQGVPPVLNPYDENCLEAALRIKESQPAKITVISAGKSIPKAVIKKALAVGADDLVVLEDDSFEDIDAHTTAALLTAAVKKLGEYDLILTGRMSADTNAGEVGPGMAEMLGIPGITVAQKVEVNGDTATVERALADGYEVLEVPLPCLVTVSHEIGELRSATVKGLMAAQKQAFTTWKAADLDIDPASIRQSRPLKLFIPERAVDCDMISGETPEEVGANLALKLRDSQRI
jgi:electron transfer flavoprotein beta subunit